MKINNFSIWKKWGDRGELRGISDPGVYAIFISDKNLSGKDFSLIKQIVYFSMSNARNGLKGRLRDFNNVLVGKKGHGGAQRLVYKWRYQDMKDKLYVSVRSFKCDVRSSNPSDLREMGKVARSQC